MIKIAINRCWGGFSLSREALHRLRELGCKSAIDEIDIGEKWPDSEIDRDNPLLVRVLEELGDKASGEFAALYIIEIPDGVDWEINDYDGMESIHEKHRSWP